MELGIKGDASGRQASRGSATGQRERAAGGPGSTGRSSPGGPRSPGATPSVFGKLGLTGDEASILEGVARAYPQVHVRTTPDLIWLIFLIMPIEGLEDSALLVSACPRHYVSNLISWAWWWPLLTWIGPRHTNYSLPGSICSFEPDDQTWEPGESLVTLLDLQVVWIVRHMFMRRFGRWPGRQVLHNSWERLTEQRPGELCGGCRSGRRYEECCEPADRAADPVDRLFLFIKWLHRNFDKWSVKDFQRFMNQGPWIPDRHPPTALAEFVYGYRKDPPSWNQLIPSS